MQCPQCHHDNVPGRKFCAACGQALAVRCDRCGRMLGALQLAEFIYEQPAAGEVEYTFKHALTQEVAYHSVLSERRKLLHEGAAAAIEALGPARVEDHLMEVAHHYGRSGNVPKAVEYLGRAGHRAARQAAHAEAADHFRRVLDLLSRLPESAERMRQELELGQALVEMLRVTKGPPASETIAAIARVAALAEQSGTLAQLADSVVSRCGMAAESGDLPTATALADQALDLARREGNPARLGAAHCLQVATRSQRGDLAGAEEHFTTGRAFFDDPGFRDLPGFSAVLPFGFGSINAWVLGRADAARERMAEAMAAADPNNPLDMAFSEFHAALLWALLREYEQAEASASQALARAEQYQFLPVAAASRVMIGRARAQRGHATEGIALIRQGIADALEIGNRTVMPFSFLALAEAQAGAGAVDDALATIEQALQASPGDLVTRAENLRRRGELHRTKGQTELAEKDFREALALARRMGAKAWELRATMSFARLLAQQGRRDEARTMLADIYNWFTEGFDTADLKEAKALLEELADGMVPA